MADTVSFKTRVLNDLVAFAPLYDSFYVQNDYLLVSEAFTKKPYYIIQAEKTNFLHLVGVSTSLRASDFFDKCLNGTIQESDFELTSHGKSEKESKGSIRRKIKSLPAINGLITDASRVQEDFQKNVVYCSFASASSTCTMGFIDNLKARPKTLLAGNALDETKAKPLTLALKKIRGEDKYSTIVVGKTENLADQYDDLKELLSAELCIAVEKILKERKEKEKELEESETAENNMNEIEASAATDALDTDNSISESESEDSVE